MSSHDARQDNPQGYDEPGSTTTRTDPNSPDRGGPITDDGPVLLPVDSGPEPTVDDRATAGDTAPVTIEDPEDSEGLRSGDREVITDRDVAGDGVKDDRDSAADAEQIDGTQATVGPDTETGALKDPVPDGTFDSDAASGTSGSASGAAESSSASWQDLQGRFVDDPQAAVREAGALVEKAFNDLRSRSESGDTEDLRTAFRRYRELYNQLS